MMATECLLFNLYVIRKNINYIISLKGKGKYGKMIEEKGIKFFILISHLIYH